MRVLSQQVQLAEVEVTVDLSEIPSSFEKLLNLRAGDVLPIDIPADVTAKIDGVPAVMAYGHGIFNGQYALAHAQDD